MFSRMNDEDVRYCVLHSYEELPDFTASDVDIAIDHCGLKKVEKIVFELADALGFNVIQKIYYDTPRCTAYIVSFFCDGGLPGFIQLDFLCDEWGINRCVMKSEDFLADRGRCGLFFVPSASAEFCYIITKRVVKENFEPRHRTRLKSLYDQDRQGVHRFCGKIFGEGGLAAIMDLVGGGPGLDEAGVLWRLKNRLRIRQIILRPHLMFFKACWQVRRALERIVRPIGLTVAIISPDGGGKSTLSENMRINLRRGFKRTIGVHWRPELLPFPGRLLRPGTWKMTEPPNYSPHAHQIQSRLVSLIRFFYYMVDYLIGYYVKILPAKVRGSLTVFERYYYDFLVDRRRFRLDLPERFAARLLPLIPKPDLVVFLNGPPEVIFARKQEITLQEIDRQLQAIRSVAPLLGNVREIRVDQPFCRELAEADAIVMEVLASRLRKRLGI